MAGIFTLLTAGTAQAQPRTADAGSGTRSLPVKVEQRIAALEASGAKILDVTSAPYVKADAKKLAYGTEESGKAEATPAAYPTGCGLWVLVYRQGNLIYNDSLTSCLYQVLDIQMHSGLAWSRWFGWEELYSQTFDTDDSSSLDTYIWVDCTGSGTHDYQGVTNGFIETYSGDEYYAAAYDQIDRIECG
ncbi:MULTISPECIES: hypothetical protein [unclassified Streptomyces]|uniref:hypothetical protein n=1 Tax=unclassified Streptomyces TaxID=2593676 RepID=UPI0013A6E6D4|nr:MULTISPECIES: hypothetical protein [unclassified Streptomyces]QZZ25239.1 hypothetical protein A7X85_02055 [Streptomyces sp. ST1015]